MGKDQRRTFGGGKEIPGPGAYSRIESQYRGGNMFGNEKRLGEMKESNVKNPGPGNYNIPSTLSNLPEYTKAKNK